MTPADGRQWRIFESRRRQPRRSRPGAQTLGEAHQIARVGRAILAQRMAQLDRIGRNLVVAKQERQAQQAAVRLQTPAERINSIRRTL